MQKFAEQDFAEYLIKTSYMLPCRLHRWRAYVAVQKAILRVIFRLKEVGWTFEIETNGTIEVPRVRPTVYSFILFLLSSRIQTTKRKKREMGGAKALIEHANVVVKLVVKGREELEEVVGFVEKAVLSHKTSF